VIEHHCDRRMLLILVPFREKMQFDRVEPGMMKRLRNISAA